jgi:hypothetical protein
MRGRDNELPGAITVRTLLPYLVVVVLVVLVTVWIKYTLYPRIQQIRMTRAVSEIKGANLAFTKLLTDANANYISKLLTDPSILQRPTFEETIAAHTEMARDLLMHGKDALAPIAPQLRKKLATSYMDLGKDRWGNDYQFYFGPLKGTVNARFFRSYRGHDYVYDMKTYENEEKKIPGNPKPETDTPPGKGYPCPSDLPVYIFSLGANGKPDQLPWDGNGGDDVNNWDAQSGWSEEFYLLNPASGYF